MRDPALVFGVIFAIPAIQLLAWSIARHASDTTVAAAAVLAFATVFPARILYAMGFDGTNPVAFYLGSALIVWICTEIFYEVDLWHKIVLAAVCPGIGLGAYVAALAFKAKVFTV